VLGLSVNDAVKQMRGKPGETVTLTIAREKSDPFDVKIVREIIKTKTAVGKIDGDYGVLRVSGFNENTTTEAEEAFAKIKAQKPNMKGLILDLRNNPGGLLDQAVSISDLFLEGGEIVSQRGRDPRDVERYKRPAGRHHQRPADRGADQLPAPPRPPRSSPAPCRTGSAPRSSA